jgi:hypothetical protein
MTQQDLEGVLRQLTGELAAARADIASLLQIQKDNAADRLLVHSELRSIDRRLIAVEIAVQAIMDKQKADEPNRARIASWIAVGSFVLFLAGALVPTLILDWWISQ